MTILEKNWYHFLRTDCVPGIVLGTLISFTAGNLRANLYHDAMTDGDIEAPGFLSKAGNQTQVAWTSELGSTSAAF